jgi:hypothetical protein
MMTPEGYIKKQIRDWLHEHGAYVFSPVQQGYGASTLDILCCWEGKFVAIEVKAQGKKPTDRQLAIMAQIIAAGGIAIVAWSLTDVLEMLFFQLPWCRPPEEQPPEAQHD